MPCCVTLFIRFIITIFELIGCLEDSAAILMLAKIHRVTGFRGKGNEALTEAMWERL